MHPILFLKYGCDTISNTYVDISYDPFDIFVSTQKILTHHFGREYRSRSNLYLPSGKAYG